MNPDLSTEETIRKSLEGINIHCEKEVISDGEGHFRLKLMTEDKQLAVWYGWDGVNNTFHPSNVADIILNDVEHRKTYIAYMTEVNASLMDEVLLQVAYLADKYFKGDFEVIDEKKEYLRFGGEGLKYTEYVLAGEYQETI